MKLADVILTGALIGCPTCGEVILSPAGEEIWQALELRNITFLHCNQCGYQCRPPAFLKKVK